MRPRESGQATLELALALPFLVFIVAFLIEVGMLASDGTRLWHAAREAVRVAAVDSDQQHVVDAARSSGLSEVEVGVSPLDRERRRGEPITVTLAYSPRPRIPVIGHVFGGIELTAEASMRIENP